MRPIKADDLPSLDQIPPATPGAKGVSFAGGHSNSTAGGPEIGFPTASRHTDSSPWPPRSPPQATMGVPKGTHQVIAQMLPGKP